MTRLIALTALLLIPAPIAVAEELRADISEFVETFHYGALNERHKASLARVVDRTDLTHGRKVLMVHSILVDANALGHVDIHQGPLKPAQNVASEIISTKNETRRN